MTLIVTSETYKGESGSACFFENGPTTLSTLSWLCTNQSFLPRCRIIMCVLPTCTTQKVSVLTSRVQDDSPITVTSSEVCVKYVLMPSGSSSPSIAHTSTRVPRRSQGASLSSATAHRISILCPGQRCKCWSRFEANVSASFDSDAKAVENQQ